MANVKSSNGGDPTKAVIQGLEAEVDELTRDAIDLWFKESQEWLRDAERNRSELGRTSGSEGRANNALGEIAQTAQPPTWNEDEQRWEFSYTHEGAVFQEFGAKPHEIRAKKAEVLAFEWPDAPEEVKEQFEHTEGDLVFFESVNHPGIPAIGFVRYGRDVAKRELETAGYDVTEWESGGDQS
ncbi:hypothetical protein DNAM5_118 [Haloarcula californiae tailed virus 1]|uniref:Uncharacterized protein n=1 Tax=Haloarcula californiae tailed virus 1 TaxID=1273746 RepID=R4TML5_9CAUD|nr:hypothetical protein M202_gp101 [Haloarcula californiae tailed virus 1]AGM11977.1 hypothetical protein DNAM5_118 [Haloarcula californiae tailed virus 1]UBF23105.1 hypothetical protein HCTV-16_gp122 [Haloarcula virus HCTV-16]